MDKGALSPSRSCSQKNENYFAVVDMGSNGIRFSITDLSPPITRTLPTIYQERCSISLYDAQYKNGKQVPIPDAVMEKAIDAMRGFQRACEAYGILPLNIKLVATEATRNALNHDSFLHRIEEATGWTTKLLPKEEEGKFGAFGIASSVDADFTGLVIDMGGGSCQLMWVEKRKDGDIVISNVKSFPYGAASLTARFEAMSDLEEKVAFRDIVSKNLKSYLKDLESSLSATGNGSSTDTYDLFLSGGGFRRWGHFLMNTDDVQPYPVPIVNGYRVAGERLKTSAFDDKDPPEHKTHRISERGASQLPAIKFFLRCFINATSTSISSVTFCQGGIREGLLYESLSPAIRAQDPLEAFTRQYRPPSDTDISALIAAGIPVIHNNDNDGGSSRTQPHARLITPLANTILHHFPWPKDVRAAAALRSTSTGALGAVHGLSHTDRTLFAIALCERWGGQRHLPGEDQLFYTKLQDLWQRDPLAVWWAKYIGGVAKAVAGIYPAGLVPRHDPAVEIHAIHLLESSAGKTEGGGDGDGKVRIEFRVLKREYFDTVTRCAEDLGKLGKKSRWVEVGEEGKGKGKRKRGMRVDAVVAWAGEGEEPALGVEADDSD